MEYRLADQGHVFSSRDRGARLRADLREKTGDGSLADVVINFEDILSVTYSFADEFIGQLVQDAGDGIPRCVNVAPGIARTIERSLKKRSLDTSQVLEDCLQVA